MSATTTEATDSTPPAILPLIVGNLPLADLAPYRQFVTWNLEWRNGKNGNPGKWTKPPTNPHIGNHADCGDPGDPATWGAWEDVFPRYDRVGFKPTRNDPFGFIDIDNGIDGTGTVKPWAQEIVDRFPTYWERSPSSCGLKGLIRGKPTEDRITPVGDGKVELFGCGKFTTLTGHRLEGAPATITDCQAELDILYAELFPAKVKQPQPRATVSPANAPDVATIIERTLRTTKGRQLHGDGNRSNYPSRSESILALLNLYVSAGATTPDQLDRIFRQSALHAQCEDRWDDERLRTIDITKALNGYVQLYDWDTPHATITRSATAQRPTVPAADSQTLRFAPGPCADRVAQLEAENAALRAALAERDQLVATQVTRIVAQDKRIETLKTVQLATNRIIGNRSHGPSRIVAAVVATEIAWRATAGDTPPQERDWDVPRGTMAISLGRIANRAGVSVNTASSHLQALEDRGLIRKETKTVLVRAGDVKDPESGELHSEDNYVTQLFIGPAKITPINAQAAVDLSNTLANFSIERTENRGGKRTPRCPDHPDAAVIREITDRCSIPSCKRELSRESYPLPAMLLGPPEDAPTPPATESQTLGFTHTAVADRLYSPQSLGFGQNADPQRSVSRTLTAGSPAPVTGLRTPPGRCLDCGEKVPNGTHYCSKHGGLVPPMDHRPDVSVGAD